MTLLVRFWWLMGVSLGCSSKAVKRLFPISELTSTAQHSVKAIDEHQHNAVKPYVIGAKSESYDVNNTGLALAAGLLSFRRSWSFA